MKIESVDFFYLAMPVVTTEADGSQDALLVRVSAGGMSAGANARRHRCRRLPPLSVPCRTACAARSAPRFSARRWTGPTTSRACRPRSPTTAWTCCRPPTPFGRRDGHVGPAGTRASGARVETLGLQGEPPQGPLRLAPFWRHAATDARGGQAFAGAGLQGGEVRLGTNWARQRQGRRRAFRCRA